MDKEERYELRQRQNIERQFARFSPPHLPELPSVEQHVLTELYTGFRKYYLQQRQTPEWRYGYLEWAKGFSEGSMYDEGLGHYQIREGRIVALKISEKFIGLLPAEIS